MNPSLFRSKVSKACIRFVSLRDSSSVNRNTWWYKSVQLKINYCQELCDRYFPGLAICSAIKRRNSSKSIAPSPLKSNSSKSSFTLSSDGFWPRDLRSSRDGHYWLDTVCQMRPLFVNKISQHKCNYSFSQWWDLNPYLRTIPNSVWHIVPFLSVSKRSKASLNSIFCLAEKLPV